MWSQFLLPKVPIWSPFYSKLGPPWVPILNNLGPHFKQFRSPFHVGAGLTIIACGTSLFSHNRSSQKNPDPSGQFRTIIGTLVRIRTKFRIPDLIEPRLGLGGLEWSLWWSPRSTSAQVHCGEVQVQLCFASLNRRSDIYIGFGIWDLARKLATKAKFGPFGQNRDFFRTILGPFRDFLSLFS